jgi:DNA-binding response OmpR family regulator
MLGKRILLVDDEEFILTTYSLLLGENGFPVVTAPSGRKALEEFTRNTFDLVITDLAMPDGDGFTVIDEIKEKSPNTPIIALTGKPSESVRKYAALLGADALLEKPCSNEEFISSVKTSLERNTSYQQSIKIR